MALTDLTIRNAKPGAKAIKLADGGGMFLLVTQAGGKLWRLKFRIEGREKLLALGSYPEIGLGEARRRREEARELIALGKDHRVRSNARRCALAYASAIADVLAILESAADDTTPDELAAQVQALIDGE